MSGRLRIIPLGGLGEIGLNMLVLEVDGAAIAIDCGVMFPERPGLGIDLLLPDVTYLRERPGLLRAVVLTHGHEDHIGALPRLLAEIPVPVLGPRLAIALTREKLRRARQDASLEILEPGQRVTIGPFEVEAVHITHSIVDSIALAIRTPVGTVVHSGDFKLDERPLDGRTANLARIEELGREGVLLLLSDSTNVEQEGVCGFETDVGPRIEAIMRGIPGRTLVTTFASHRHRVQQIVDASAACGRAVAIAGRGFEDATRLAGELGYLKVPQGFITLDEAMRRPPPQVTVLISGSQGEPNSALTRLSEGRFKNLSIEPGDGVVLSSRIIPGNERGVYALLNRLSRHGASVHRGERAGVHVSGHAYRDELRQLIRLVRPRYFVPVHGEHRQLDEHRRLAADTGIALDHCFLLEDGDVLELDASSANLGERVVAGRVLVDSSGEGEVGLEVLRDRRHLSEDGFVVAVIAIHQQTGEVTTGPELIARGVVREGEGEEVLIEAKNLLRDELKTFTPESRADLVEMEDEVRRVLKRYFSRVRGRRPLIVPHIFEM
jgi:ribonuclease J